MAPVTIQGTIRANAEAVEFGAQRRPSSFAVDQDPPVLDGHRQENLVPQCRLHVVQMNLPARRLLETILELMQPSGRMLPQDGENVDVALGAIVAASDRTEEHRECDVRLGSQRSPQPKQQSPVPTDVAGLPGCQQQLAQRDSLGAERSLGGRPAQGALVDAYLADAAAT